MHFLQNLKWQWFNHKTSYNFELTSMAFIGLCMAFFTTWYWFGLNVYHLIPKSPLVTQFWYWNIKHGFHLINQRVLAFIGLCSSNFIFLVIYDLLLINTTQKLKFWGFFNDRCCCGLFWPFFGLFLAFDSFPSWIDISLCLLHIETII